MLREPLGQLLDCGHSVSASVVIPFGPTGDLTLHVPLRRSQIAQTRRFVIDFMNLSEVLNKRLRKTTHYFGREFDTSRWLCTQNDSFDALHHVERRAEYLFVLAKEERPWDFVVDGMKMRKDAILAAHVMRCFYFGADRRTPEHEFAISGSQHVSEIGKARGKLFYS